MGRRVDVKVGFNCNNYCKFCVQGDKRDRYEDKPTKRVKEIIKEARENHDRIVFTGGEVTIRNDLPELVKHANDLGFKNIQIQSNGRRFAYRSYCRKIIESGANDFGFAIHGPNPEIHDNLTGAEGSFSQTTMGVKNLVSMGQRVSLNHVITKENYKAIPKTADLFIKLGVPQYQLAFIHINRIVANDKKKIEDLVPKKSDVIPYVKEGIEKGVAAGINVMTEAIPLCFLGEKYKKFAAEMGQIPDGAVYDADFSLEDYAEYRKNEGKKKAEKCKECKYYKICEGPWKEYPDIFGWGEFIPVKKDCRDS